MDSNKQSIIFALTTVFFLFIYFCLRIFSAGFRMHRINETKLMQFDKKVKQWKKHNFAYNIGKKTQQKHQRQKVLQFLLQILPTVTAKSTPRANFNWSLNNFTKYAAKYTNNHTLGSLRSHSASHQNNKQANWTAINKTTIILLYSNHRFRILFGILRIYFAGFCTTLFV